MQHLLRDLDRTARGYSYIEVVVVLAILAVLGGIALAQFHASRTERVLTAAADTLVVHLQAAQADALAGRGGEGHGVKFDAGRYARFSGDTYSAGAETVEVVLDDRIEIVHDLADSDGAVVFARVTGAPSETATVTLRAIDDATHRTDVIIGPHGEVSVVDYE